MRLRLTDDSGALVPLVQVGGEGGLLDNAVVQGGMPGGFDTGYGHGEILLPPGSRADVVAAIPSSATGTLTMWTEDYSRTGGGFADIPTVPVMHLRVTGSPVVPAYTIADGTPLRAATGDPVPVIGPATATLLDPSAFSPPKLGLASQDIKLTQTPNDVLGIDGDLRDARCGRLPNRAAPGFDPLRDARRHARALGHEPDRWRAPSVPPARLLDAADQPHEDRRAPTRLAIQRVPRQHRHSAGLHTDFRIKIVDRPLADGVTMGGAYGRWLFHCHIFFHATNGMLSELVIVQPNGNEKPDVSANEYRWRATTATPSRCTARITIPMAIP